jgi:cell division septum initiation protein DivIVA
MPRSIKSYPLVGNRIPSQEEMLQIVQEQRRFIENLKLENYNLQQQIAAMQDDRSVAHIMNMAQKNAEEILRHARREADEILETTRRQSQKTLDQVDGYVQQILETEDALDGLLSMLRKFRMQMLSIDEAGMQEGFRDVLSSHN